MPGDDFDEGAVERNAGIGIKIEVRTSLRKSAATFVLVQQSTPLSPPSATVFSLCAFIPVQISLSVASSIQLNRQYIKSGRAWR